MGNDFTTADPFFTGLLTPDFGSFQTKGTLKYLAAIFIVDCSKTMENGRIGAVNNALKELKYKLTEIKNDNNLDLRIAIMSFTSSARWEVSLTPIEEFNFENIRTRPGLTEYGAAFHELNKVLTKECFMKHTGKIAPPAIMFLTDGEPTDDYTNDLDELLKNGWFANASRSAVLIGDAIYNDKAKLAVSKFVNDADNDIVTAEDSTLIIQKIQLATMHTIAGDPMPDDENKTSNQDDFEPIKTQVDDIFKNDSVPGIILDDSVPGIVLDDPFPGTVLDDPFPGTVLDDSFSSSYQGDSFANNPFDTF